jgi:hypothetical protein
MIEMIKKSHKPEELLPFFETYILNGSFGAHIRGLDDGPYFFGDLERVWKNELFRILRFLFGEQLEPGAITRYKQVRLRNNLRIIRCLVCNNRYQHPDVFESYFAFDFYANNFIEFVNKEKLVNIFDPHTSYHSAKVEKDRAWLNRQYDKYNIKINDFVEAQFHCPHCSAKTDRIEHDLFKITKNLFGFRQFKFVRENAPQSEFES